LTVGEAVDACAFMVPWFLHGECVRDAMIGDHAIELPSSRNEIS